MTFVDDFVQILQPGEPFVRVTCSQLGIDWPPPEFVIFRFGGRAVREYFLKRHSAISDEQRELATAMVRGAEYVPLRKGKVPPRTRTVDVPTLAQIRQHQRKA